MMVLYMLVVSIRLIVEEGYWEGSLYVGCIYSVNSRRRILGWFSICWLLCFDEGKVYHYTPLFNEEQGY